MGEEMIEGLEGWIEEGGWMEEKNCWMEEGMIEGVKAEKMVEVSWWGP